MNDKDCKWCGVNLSVLRDNHQPNCPERPRCDEHPNANITVCHEPDDCIDTFHCDKCGALTGSLHCDGAENKCEYNNEI